MMNVEYLVENNIDINAALELLGDLDMYNETIKDFIDESNTRIPNIDTYYNNEDWVNYEILVHAQKSDSKYLGFTKLAELSYNHEMAVKENNIDYIKNNYQELVNEQQRVLTIIKTYIGV